jgi:hypothetical protein
MTGYASSKKWIPRVYYNEYLMQQKAAPADWTVGSVPHRPPSKFLMTTPVEQQEVPHQLTIGKEALIIIDVQRGFGCEDVKALV